MVALRLLAIGLLCTSLCILGTDATAGEKKLDTDLLIGSWKVAKASPGTVPEGSVVAFLKGGKLKVEHKGKDKDITLEGTYKVAGSKITLSLKVESKEIEKTIKIKTLNRTHLTTEDEDGKVVELTRKK